MKKGAVPLTLSSATVWAITTALIGWAGNVLMQTYVKTERNEVAIQHVEQALKDCK